MISQNMNSLSAHANTTTGIARNKNITSNLLSLKKIFKLFSLQETHLKRSDQIALSRHFKNWGRIYNNADGRKGTMMLIHPSILKHYKYNDISPDSITRGRVQVVNFLPKNPSGNAAPFKVINCYFPTGGVALNARRINIFNEITKLAPAEKMHTFLMSRIRIMMFQTLQIKTL